MVFKGGRSAAASWHHGLFIANQMNNTRKAVPRGTALSSSRERFGGKISADGRGFAQVLAFHGHPAAPVAYEFHGRQLAFAHMGVVDFGRAAERAVLLVAAGTAEMPGFLGHRTAGFTGISHIRSPLWGAVRTARGLFDAGGSYTGLIAFVVADDPFLE